MKPLFSFIIFFNCLSSAYSQNTPVSKYIKLSGGYIVFGTGDVPGYGISVEATGNFIKKNDYLNKHFQLGGEIFFQTGVKNPKVVDPNPGDFYGKSFRHYSLGGLNAKFNFYLFRSFLKGLNISLAGGLAYQNYSAEARAEIIEYSPTFSRRMSELRFENTLLLGYTISVGYDVYIVQDKLFIGPRIDLANYNNGDFNSLLGGKIGFLF